MKVKVGDIAIDNTTGTEMTVDEIDDSSVHLNGEKYRLGMDLEIFYRDFRIKETDTPSNNNKSPCVWCGGSGEARDDHDKPIACGCKFNGG